MIRLLDRSNLMPDLSRIWPGRVTKGSIQNHDVEILATWDRECQASDCPTVILDTEPEIDHAHITYADLLIKRPNSLWVHNQLQEGRQWQVPRQVFYAAHLVMTARANPKDRSWVPGPKRYLAHALLGGWTLPRGYLYRALANSGLIDRCLVNYQPRPKQFIIPPDYDVIGWLPSYHQELFQQYQSPDLAALDDALFLDRAYSQGGLMTMVPVDLESNDRACISQIIPWRIFDATGLALVAETSAHSFIPTEKIAKPLLAGQPFIVFGCQHFLAHLRRLGFMTFDPWIDESYDDISDHGPRAQAVIDSLQRFAALADERKQSISHELAPRLIHNAQLMRDMRHWHQPVVEALEQML